MLHKLRTIIVCVMFANFLILPLLHFKESKRKNVFTVKLLKTRFSKHFANIFRVQKWMSSLYCNFRTGCDNSAKFARFYWMEFKTIKYHLFSWKNIHTVLLNVIFQRKKNSIHCIKNPK